MARFSFHRQKDPTAMTQHNPSSPQATESETAWVDIAGRRHHADAPYLLPSDEEEIHRLDFQHYILRSILKGNYLAPIHNPMSILDVGCGTGRWGAEMAHVFPQAIVVGFDLSLPEMTSTQYPQNCRFEQGNVLQGLSFAEQSFDFVHQRLLVFAIPTEKWIDEIRELMRVMRPGGWLELVEVDIAYEQMGPASALLAEWATNVSKQRGIDPGMARKIGTTMEAAGLINVKTQKIPNPIGDWGGRIGKMAATGVQAVNRAMRQQVIAQLNIAPTLFDQTLTQSQEEFNRYQSFSYAFVSIGQRPPTSAQA